MSQSPRRPRPRPQQPSRRPPSARTHRSQAIYSIVAAAVVFILIAGIAGPPIVDYLTRPDNGNTIDASQAQAADPVEAEYQTAVASDPGNAETLAAYGNYLGNTGRVDEAIPWYEKALAVDPNNWDIRLGFGRVLAAGNKRPDAELQFKKALELKPNDPQTLFSLAQLYANWVPPRTQDAIDTYRLTIQYGGDSFVSQRAAEELSKLGVATGSPVPAGSPAASPAPVEGTP